jgi:Tfp pilus assembly protein PilN
MLNYIKRNLVQCCESTRLSTIQMPGSPLSAIHATLTITGRSRKLYSRLTYNRNLPRITTLTSVEYYTPTTQQLPLPKQVHDPLQKHENATVAPPRQNGTNSNHCSTKTTKLTPTSKISWTRTQRGSHQVISRSTATGVRKLLRRRRG